MVSRIDGAGQSCVMITMDSTREAIYARDLREAEDTSSTSEAGRSANSGNISREETHILMNRGSAEEPLVEKQIEPQVRGVMVLCEGAENPVVERRITEAVRTVLGIPTSRICVEKISN